MSSFFALRALLFAGECVVGSAVILGTAWLAAQTIRRASLRHLVWLGAFAALLALPVAALIVPPRILVQQHSEAPARLPVLSAPDDAATSIADDTLPQFALPAKAESESGTSSALGVRQAAYALFALWLIGALANLGRLAFGALALEPLRRRSRPHALDTAGLPQGPRVCELRLSDRDDGPVTWGVFHPVILLPRASRNWPRARLTSVLLHELAHVRRKDSLTQTLAQFVAALYWPNPLMRVALRALRREAEMAADDAVLVHGIKPSAYAGELVQLAGELGGRKFAHAGMSMAGSALEARVKSALAHDQSRTGVTAMDALKIGLFGLAATAALAFARPDIVQADDATPPAPPAVAASDLPPPPPAPPAIAQNDVPPAPPAPPAPAALPEPPAPPAPPDVDDESPAAHHHHHKIVRIIHSGDMRADMAQMEAEMHRAQIEMDKVRPEIDRALSDAQIDRKIAEAMRDVEPRIRAEVERALAKARPEIRKAMAEAHISEKVAKALAEAQPKIDAAMAKIHGDRKVRIEMHDDDASTGDDNDDNDMDGNDGPDHDNNK